MPAVQQAPETGTVTTSVDRARGRTTGRRDLERLLEGVRHDPVNRADPYADPRDGAVGRSALDRLEHASQ